jgi:3-hydroxybutyryl-CoA dehydrogenase
MDVQHITVLGAGTMGHGIAQVCAVAGFTTILYDISPDAAQQGLVKLRQNLEGGVTRGKLTAEARDAALARLSASAVFDDAVRAADVVIEAAPEKMELKRHLFSELDRAAPAHAILASNTSSLSVGQIAEAVSRPANVVGMHFFNPVHIMKLLEIVRHDRTSDETADVARWLGEKLGKEPIVVRDVAGFASSRLGVLLGLEAARMLEEGVASAADIDKAMKLGYGHPMGPLELGDHVGLDVRLAIAEHLTRELGPRFEPPPILRRLVSEGKLGKKTGEGFHKW